MIVHWTSICAERNHCIGLHNFAFVWVRESKGREIVWACEARGETIWCWCGASRQAVYCEDEIARKYFIGSMIYIEISPIIHHVLNMIKSIILFLITFIFRERPQAEILFSWASDKLTQFEFLNTLSVRLVWIFVFVFLCLFVKNEVLTYFITLLLDTLVLSKFLRGRSTFDIPWISSFRVYRQDPLWKLRIIEASPSNYALYCSNMRTLKLEIDFEYLIIDS